MNSNGFNDNSGAGNQITDSSSIFENPLQGVKGWLLFFVYMNLYIAPVFIVISSLLMFTGLFAIEKLDSVVFAILIITTTVDLIFVVYGIVVALALRDVKPGA